MSEKTVVNGNCGFFGMLTLLLIAFKLTHVIQWSWWWVLSPLWIPFSVAILAALIFVVVLVWSSVR